MGRQSSATGQGDRTIAWNFCDLPSRITAVTPSQDISFLYDAFHSRAVKNLTGGDRVIYLDEAYERYQSTAGVTHRFKLLGGRAQVQWTVIIVAAKERAPSCGRLPVTSAPTPAVLR
jgi:hypothetical protein